MYDQPGELLEVRSSGKAELLRGKRERAQEDSKEHCEVNSS